MTDAIAALPPIADPTMAGGGIGALSMKMGAGGNIDKVSKDFEAVFATQLLQPMFEGIAVDSTFGGGHGEEVMRSFMLQEYGKLIAKSGKLGIASQVKAEMLRSQEGSSGSRAASARFGKMNPYNKVSAPAPSTQGEVNVSIQ